MRVRLGTLRELLREVLLAEQAIVPARGVPTQVDDHEAMGETDERMLGDEGNGDIAPHLRSDDDGLTLGDPVEESVNAEIRKYLMQEVEDDQQQPPEGEEAAAGAGAAGGAEATSSGSETSAPTGFYVPFDMERDHSATWYRSPGRAAGTDGDPFRGEDPHSQLGFHPPKPNDTTSHPASAGEPVQLAPPIWQLSAGSDTSKVLGANAKRTAAV